MQSTLKFLYTTLAAFYIVSSVVPVLPKDILPRDLISTAQAATSNPTSFQVGVKDHQCADQAGSSAFVGPGGSSPATDSNAKDPDCGRINFVPGDVASTPQNQSIYSNDFRIGTRLNESNGSSCSPGRDPSINGSINDSEIRWTPWVSEGGGASWGATASPNINDPDCLWIYYETRALPAGTLIKDVRAGVSTGNGAMQFTAWARSGGGWSGYSGGGNISPARVQLDVQFVEIYDAEYVSDTIPNSMQRDQSGSYDIVMKNKATTWNSDVYTPDADQCPPPTPQNAGETCNETGTATSSLIKLKRIDTDADIDLIAPTASSPLIYERSLSRTYTATDVCITWGTSASLNESSSFALADMLKIKTALARIPGDEDPDDPDGPGFPICIEWGLEFYLSSQTPANSNIINTDTGSFPISIQVDPAAAFGTHTIRFQMMQLDSNGNEIGEFGSAAAINIDIGSGPALSCTAIAIVNESTDPAASTPYSVYMTGLPGGYNGNVTVTLNTQPQGITANPPSTILNPANSYTGTMTIVYGVLGTGTYSLVFSATDGIFTTTCPAQLQINSGNSPTVDLKFDNQNGPVSGLPNNYIGMMSWETTNVTSCTASSTPLVNGDAGSGTITWDGPMLPLNNPFPTTTNVGPLTTGTYNFTLTCTGLGGNASDSVQVTVDLPLQPPTVDLYCEGTLDITPQPGPCNVDYGTAGILEWSSAGATTCSFDNGIGAVALNNLDPGITTGNLFSNTTFTLTCTNSAGSTPKSITFNITASPTFILSCNPATVTINQGDATAYGLSTTPVDGFNSAVTFTLASINPSAGTLPTVTFTKNGEVPPHTTNALVSTTSSTTVGIYTLTFEGTGGGVTQNCNVELIVNAGSPPFAPVNVAVDNTGVCGTINLSWERGQGGQPTAFRIYRAIDIGILGEPNWQAVVPDVPYAGDITYTYTDSSPLNPTGSNYYGVSALIGLAESSITEASSSPIVPQACSANLNNSDKDFTSVKQGTKTVNNPANPNPCTGNPYQTKNPDENFILPNNGLFKDSDIATFQINVCNSGTVPLTSVVVTDTLTNLISPTAATSPQDCISSQSVGPDIDQITFNLKDIAAPSEPGKTEVCSIVFSARVTNPATPLGTYYRFQNTAIISTAELADYEVFTIPYIIAAGSAPIRNEIPPQ